MSESIDTKEWMDKMQSPSEDWRNENNYTYLKNFPEIQIAWEFLRRNTKYQREWRRVHEKWSGLKDTRLLPHYGILDYGAREWLLNAYYPPAMRHIELSFLHSRFGSLKRLHDHYHDTGNADNLESWRPFYFDLERPIEQQFNAAKDILLKEQKAYHKKIGNKLNDKNFQAKEIYIRYLRIIDAQMTSDKPSNSQIAAIIFPKEQNGTGTSINSKISKNRKAAREIVENKYRSIVDNYS